MLRKPPDRIATLSNRIGYGDAVDERRKQSRLRDASTPYRAWYKTRRWKELRLKILNRDLWTCRQTGVLLKGKPPASDSPVVDHIRPHRGDPGLFWSEENLQAVSKRWHDGVKQAIDKRTP